MDKYIVLYGDKKPEDNVMIRNMFENTIKINLGWVDYDFKHNWQIIEEQIKQGIDQIIFSGFEIGWDKLVISIKEKYPNVKVKVICNTLDSLLYYDYERVNFFRLLELSKNNTINDIAFLRKGQFETYSSIGYKCSYLQENYELKNKKQIINNHEKINIGIYPLNYVWDKNIFNQLCIPKFIEDSNLNFNNIDPRMEDFLETMNIKNTKDKIDTIEDSVLIEKISKNDVIVSCSFTEYFHPIFFISMELGIPCLIGNNIDFFTQDDELCKYVVTSAEDNPIINSEIIKTMIKEKDKIQKIYQEWKKQYNKKSRESIESFINK